MRPLIFKCLATGLKVQGLIDEELISPNTISVSVDCPICKRPHLINLATGKAPSNEAKD